MLGAPCAKEKSSPAYEKGDAMADLDDLQAAFEQVVAAMNTRNLDAFSTLVHNEKVYFGPASPFPLEGKAARLQHFQRVSTTNESVTVTPIKPQFRVIGTTGIVWLHFALMRKPKDGSMTNVADIVCATLIFAKSDGNWLMVAEHQSRLPPGN